MKIVIPDGYVLNPGDLSWKPLKEMADEFVVYDRMDVHDMKTAIEVFHDADIIATDKFPVNKEIIDGCPNLKAVAVTATGYNIVDTEYAKEKGIVVMNVPAYGTQIVSQYTVGMLLDLCGHFEHHDAQVKAGRWASCPDFCFWDYPMIGLFGKTAGIIGLGAIGQATAKVLGALGMRVIAVNPSHTDAGRAVAEYVEMETLLAESDVILLHCPLFPSTEGIINKDTIAKMKDGVILINTSRGPLIIEQDLADALNNGKVAAAAVDVVSTEPIKNDNPLLKAKNCIITPHIAWAAADARQKVMDVTVANVRSFIEGMPQNVVNQ